MKVLHKAKITDVFFLLHGKNYEQVYSKLQRILSPEEHAFFSRIQYQANSVAWMSSVEGRVTSYSKAGEHEKEEATALIQELHQSIRKKVENDPEIGGIVDQLLMVPSEEEILIFNDLGKITVTLVKWGCRSNAASQGISPIGKIVELPVKDQVSVEVIATYSDGVLAANTELNFQYKGEVKTFTTNDEGHMQLGLLRYNSSFTISDPQTNEAVPVQVLEDKTQYEVTIPYYTDYSVHVINQLGEVMSQYEVNAEYSNGFSKNTSNESGDFTLEHVLVDQNPLRLISSDNANITQEYTLDRDDRLLTFEIKERIAGDISVKVVDSSGGILAGYPLQVQLGGTSKDYRSNEEGMIFLVDVELQEEVTILVKDSKNHENVREYFASRESHHFVFEADPKFVTIKLIDHKNRPIPHTQLDITPSEEILTQETDSEGNTRFGAEHFRDGEKVKAGIHLKNKKNKIRLKRKSFKYTSEQSEYILKLRKFNWWWLLLLLIPIIIAILLIKLEKDIVIHTVSQKNVPVTAAEVSLNYDSYYLFNRGEWLDTINRDTVQYTDSLGYATFARLEYTVYSYLFKRRYRPEIWVLTRCYSSDTLRPVFHKLGERDTITVELTPTLTTLDLKVVDEDDKEPLPDAEIRYQYQLDQEVITGSARTGPDGRVIIRDVPKCGNLDIAHASLYGYHPDSIMNKHLPDIQGDIDRRTLELRPVLSKLEFYVVSCATGEPIPNATTQVTLTAPDGEVTGGPANANTNGKVKFLYDDAHILSRVGIDASAPYYKLGSLDKTYRVDEFINLTESERTLCLEPEDNPIVLRNIDDRTGRGLGGVENIVTITRNGQNITTKIMSAHPSGEFVVSGLQIGDLLSISSSNDPCYEPNEYESIDKLDAITLMNGPQADRDIPLTENIVTTTFKTVDELTREAILDAGLVITVDGQRVQPTTSGNTGEISITARYCANIKIVASKTDYRTNDYTINGLRTMEYYVTSSATEREIPLQWSVSCGQATEGSQGTSYREYALGSETGLVRIEFDMKAHADIMTIYCGRGTGGRVLFSKEMVDQVGSPEDFCFRAKRCDGYITVVIEPTPGLDNSQWWYRITCPEPERGCRKGIF